MAGRGILLDDDNDLKIVGKRMLIGESTMQEVGVILQMNQGELKTVPMLGPNLVQLKKTNASRFDIEQRMRINLAMDRKDYQEIKEQVKATLYNR